ncbi:MAG: cell surface protein SprA [Saprospiraceae bacterium]
MNNKALFLFATSVTTVLTLAAFEGPLSPSHPKASTPLAQADTVPPIKDRYGDFIHDKKSNPIDLKDPASIEKTVEYDPETGRYILYERIGSDFFRPPTFMTFEEYLNYRKKQDEQEYFKQLSGVYSGKKAQESADPLAKFDIGKSLIDRLFGGTTVDIRPQGNIDLTFGGDYQRLENPILTERQRTTGGFDFDMNIQMNVTGKIGEKLNLSTNYNTNATFDFDNQIKLNYNAGQLGDGNKSFGEDEIVKKIEAGNVSLPLRGTLIQGAQSLFGLKTELQFGHLRLTAVGSQQKSQRQNLQIQGGSQVQEFEVKADQYDENRHFFLSFYNRDHFEEGLGNMPQIRSVFKLENIEVWLTNDRNEVDNVRDIVALADLGEPTRLVNPVSASPLTNPPAKDLFGQPLPDNSANGMYNRIVANTEMRQIDQAVTVLQNDFSMSQSRDFEKVSARKLKPTEYSVHPELGFISLNVNVQPDQVVAVAYQYTYNGRSYKVGELSINSENTKPDSSLNVLFVKMLKSTTQRTDIPTWDLMMKNVYPIGAFQVNQADFRLDVFYEDPGKGQKRFLPETNLAGRPLLRIFNLDRLNTQGDPQPDGVFDFVPGVTINLRNGRIMFPVLEPFGSSLARQIDDPVLREKYTYQELYDSTQFLAQEFQEKNRYVIRGNYKSSVASEISLGAFNIPPGSVRVSAGGQTLMEGRDYEVDYNIGRVRILNDAILNSGVPVDVSYEDNTLFGFQTKSLFGLRADYEVDKNFNIGLTAMKLFERPFTQKVNIGDDPINNSMYGADINLSREAPWMTKALDALPGLSTKAMSKFSLSAEAARIQPGHSRAINQNKKDEGGIVYIDDFEGSANTIDLRQPTANWFLASVPQNDAQNNNPLFPESKFVNDLRSGTNRARMSWYRIDQVARGRGDDVNPYTSLVPQIEVFPNAQLAPTDLPNVQTFDITYFPEERGPYNFDVPNGYPGVSKGVRFAGEEMLLRDPQTRWGGIMRALNSNDFQSTNTEFLEFWMLSPFLDPDDAKSANPSFQGQEGDLYINLGNISEDILRDSRKFFENGLPGPINPDRRVDTTAWSVVPVAQQITQAFDNDEQTRKLQDVGLDGLSNEAERNKFAPYLNAIRSANSVAATRIGNDPSNDDFRYYNDASFKPEDGIINRYRFFTNPEGNSRANTGTNELNSATNIPDAEDLNRDNTLNETENYFQYKIPLRANPNNPREIDINRTPFVTDRLEAANGRIWYRFRVPLNGPNKVAVGGIRDFRSIRFIRMYMHGFQKQTTLRFARLEFVRNQWRRFTQDLSDDNPIPCDAQTQFDVDAVNIEENSNRRPFNYVLPEGIRRELALGVFNTQQNEQSLTMTIRGLCEGEEKAVFKRVDLDMRVYERLKMFVHAEALDQLKINDGDLSVFVRLGSDFKNNYYEYEIPLVLSDPLRLPADNRSLEYKQEVWRPENEFDIVLRTLVALKEERNNLAIPVTDEYARELSDRGAPGLPHQIKVRGNPNLGLAKIAMIGVRNRKGGQVFPLNTEVWANELRLTGLDERGGNAAIARMDMQLADLGNIALSGNYSTIGFGQIDEKVAQRSREDIMGYDASTNLELGKFLPDKWGVRLPFYAQKSNTTRIPEYDPYDLDVVLKDKINSAAGQERDSIQQITQEVASLSTYTLTNVRKERTSSGAADKPKPWDIENFAVSYAYSRAERRDPLIEIDQSLRRTGGLDYSFTRQAKFIQPLKNLNVEALKLFSEINLNPLPNSFTFNTQLDRQFNLTRFRFTGLEERFNTFYNKRFTWDRDYNLQWDLTKSLKIAFTAINNGVVDEPDEIAMAENPNITNIGEFRRDSIWNNIQQFGRTKNYRHTLQVNYNLPIRLLPLMDWVQVRAQYQSEYGWTAAALNTDSLGNLIRNKQNIQVNGDFNFEALYNKIPFLKEVNRGGGGAPAPGGRAAPKEGEAEDKKEKAGVSPVVRAIVRPFLLARRARFNYTSESNTVVPGFMPQARTLGMGPQFGAPGWDFVAGWQPAIRTLSEADYFTDRDWLGQAAQSGWISPSVFLNQEVTQDYKETYDARLTLEPFRDFRIELSANRSFVENHAQYFKDTLFDSQSEFVHAIPKDIGSLTVSYSALKTLFQDDRSEIVSLFRQFENNRVIISQRLGQGTHADSTLAKSGYTFGYGRTQQEVLLPAFIAAYTGQDPNTTSLDVFDIFPKVNWSLSYNGLAKVKLFSELFQNFSLTHAYRSTLTINRFNTGLDYLRTKDQGGVNELNGNFYARLEIPEIVIQEGFSPLIAVNATLKNGMSFNMDYKRTRNLQLSMVSNQLAESRNKEIVIGFGYLLRNLNIPFLTGKKSNEVERGQRVKGIGRTEAGTTGAARPAAQGNDLDINFNFRLTDDITFNHLLDQGVVEPTRGSYLLSISPSAEYTLNQRLKLRLFFDYRRTEPATSAGFPRTDSAGGLVVRFTL